MNTPAKIVCNRCTYDLTGHTSDGPITCPECGQSDAARVVTLSPQEKSAVLARAGFAVLSMVVSFCYFGSNLREKFRFVVACVLVGFAVACAISARRHARGSKSIVTTVVFILVGVYTVLCFAMALD